MVADSEVANLEVSGARCQVLGRLAGFPGMEKAQDLEYTMLSGASEI